MSEFQVKDSGERKEFANGMMRDTDEGKPRYDLLDRAFLKRWAIHMAKGAKKYGDNNWRLASDEAALERFKGSAFRHLIQWLEGDQDEDHAAAVAFNLAGGEMVKGKLKAAQPAQSVGEVLREIAAQGSLLPRCRRCPNICTIPGTTYCDVCAHKVWREVGFDEQKRYEGPVTNQPEPMQPALPFDLKTIPTVTAPNLSQQLRDLLDTMNWQEKMRRLLGPTAGVIPYPVQEFDDDMGDVK